MSKKKKKGFKGFLPYIIFLLGLLVLMYPIFSQWYYRVEANNEIDNYYDALEELSNEDIAERLRLAHAYNQVLDPSRLADPYTKEEEAGIAYYAQMLEVNEKIGYVDIPKIDERIPIYAGTSERVLQKGAGHLEGTSLPVGGESTHTVITAHRGLPTAALFTQLDKMAEGDIFTIHVLGQVLAYQVDQILTVEPWDFEPVLVVDDEDYATLLTCTPYMINSHRLLVRGTRIDYTPPVEEAILEMRGTNHNFLYLLGGAVLIILILTLLIVRSKERIRDLEKKTKERETHED